MRSRIVNMEDVPAGEWSRGDRYDAQIVRIGRALESQKLGFSVAIIAPGKCAYPFHAHLTNEEMYFILEGQGKIRIGEATHPLRKGDFVSLPPGRDSAHQIINDSDAPLRYLAVSTMETPEIAEYPDSGKLGIFAGVPPVTRKTEHSLSLFARVGDAVDYWDGEELTPTS